MLPDNRLRYPAGPINFITDIGLTGQDHDNYPEAGTQPRYDWMRCNLIALLSQQSSYDEPTQYREGTPWFDLNEMALKIRRNGDWVPYSNAVLLEDGYTLADFYTEFKALGIVPELRFDGTAVGTTTTIDLTPGAIQATAGKTNLTADVFINGILVDPDNVSVAPSQIVLSGGVQLVAGDKYVVAIRNVAVSVQSGSPIVLVSPNGTQYRLVVDNVGALSTVVV